MKSILTTGYVLNKRKWNDYDLELELYTKELGRIKVVYFGITKSLRREKLSIEYGSLSNFLLVPLKKTGYDYTGYYIKETSLISSCKDILKSLFKINMLIYILHVFSKITIYNIQDDEIFNKLSKYISYIENKKDLLNKNNMEAVLTQMLLSLSKELGIYNIKYLQSILSIQEQNLLNDILNNKFKEERYLNLLLKVENHINSSLETDINYKKYQILR